MLDRKSTSAWNRTPGKSLFVSDCVVADAVAVEPVHKSNSLLTGKITSILSIRIPVREISGKIYEVNQGLDGTGNFYRMTGKAFADCRGSAAHFVSLQGYQRLDPTHPDCSRPSPLC